MVPDRRERAGTTGASFFLWIFLVALEQLDRDTLRAADEADADSRPNGRRLLRELHALGLDLRGHRIDVFYCQPEMIEPLVGPAGGPSSAQKRPRLQSVRAWRFC